MGKSKINMINGKRILAIIPAFFGYDIYIKQKLEKRGAIVKLCNSDPKSYNSTIISTFKKFKLNPNFLVKKFENSILKSIKSEKFDIVLVINGWAITSNLVKEIKEKHLSINGKMILYYWDSISVLKDDSYRRQYFDFIASFDKIDCKENKNFTFLPLFYRDEYYMPFSNKSHEVDLTTIGSFVYERYKEIEKLREINPTINILALLYNSKSQIIFHKLLRKKYSRIDLKKICFSKFSQKEIIIKYQNSSAILDIPRHEQNGLTIRTLESLAMHKKIVTTNKNIATYDFYDKSNIFILDTTNWKLPNKEWFKQPFLCIDEKIIRKYSIENWIDFLFSII